jgi:membrane fusion protein (multidrug efflux system)
VGSLLGEGDLLTTLSDNSKMWVYFNVPEAQYLDYKTNKDAMDKVTLMMANHRVFEYPGIVETIEADFDNETGNIPFRATFPNPNGLLRHGETGSILVNTAIKDAIIIPQKATFEVLDKKYVFVVDKDNRVKTREITVGADIEDLYIVKSGLADNEKILLEGLRKVKENDKIAYLYEAPKSVIHRLKLPAE